MACIATKQQEDSNIVYCTTRGMYGTQCHQTTVRVQDNVIWDECTLREESSQTNVILQYKLLASILSAVCSVIQQS